jgi:hypothetical protein
MTDTVGESRPAAHDASFFVMITFLLQAPQHCNYSDIQLVLQFMPFLLLLRLSLFQNVRDVSSHGPFVSCFVMVHPKICDYFLCLCFVFVGVLSTGFASTPAVQRSGSHRA